MEMVRKVDKMRATRRVCRLARDPLEALQPATSERFEALGATLTELSRSVTRTWTGR